MELVHAVSEAVSVPVIASGGMGSCQDIIDVIKEGKADAVSMAYVLHYDKISLSNIRHETMNANIKLRNL